MIVTSPLALGSKAKSPLIDWPRMASVPPVTLKDLVPLATVTRTPGCVEPGISINWSTSAPVSLYSSVTVPVIVTPVRPTSEMVPVA